MREFIDRFLVLGQMYKYFETRKEWLLLNPSFNFTFFQTKSKKVIAISDTKHYFQNNSHWIGKMICSCATIDKPMGWW